eukprot:6661514-Pyramimonas_sp.AAC.1
MPFPGVLYGAEVHGTSDFELGRIRREAGKVLRPRAGGRSLTSTLLLNEGPTWIAAVPPSSDT